MKKSVVTTMALLLLVAGAPLVAQNRDMEITAYVSRAEMQGDNEFEEGLETDFDDATAFGVSVNSFINRYISIEAAAFNMRNESRLLVGGGPTSIGLGKVDLTPITVGAQLHLAGRSRIDPYVGAGAAYVIAGDLSSPDLEAAGVGRIELEDKFTYYLNAGVGIQIAGGLGIVIDGRYVQYETDSRSAVTGVEQEIELSPQILSIGLRFRF